MNEISIQLNHSPLVSRASHRTANSAEGLPPVPRELYAGGVNATDLPRPDFRPVGEGGKTVAKAAVEALTQETVAQSGVTGPATSVGVAHMQRRGVILNESRILKRDHYPTLHQGRLQLGREPQPELPGAPNYRSLSQTAIQGSAQPDVAAIKTILERSNAAPGQSGPSAVWVNLREEPVLYIKGQSYCLRDQGLPYNNLEATGILPRQLEQVEENLKREAIEELQRTGGKIMVTTEDHEGQLAVDWVEVGPEDVKTPSEVYDELRAEGYRVDYHRIPMTDEKTPELQDFDALLSLLRTVPDGSPRIFNCHAGRGRTTTAMVIADMFEQARGNPAASGTLLESERFQRHYLQEEGAGSVESLARALREQSANRQLADQAIDRMGLVQNLRKAILDRTPNGILPSDEEAVRIRSSNFLDRYMMLVQFARYLSSASHDGFRESFGQWVSRHPEVYETIELAGKTLDTWHTLQG